MPYNPDTAIYWAHGLRLTRGTFRDEPNDGVVSVSATSAAWIGDAVIVPVVHTFLPTSARVAEIILARISNTSLR